jgi:hypothetical protein
VSTGTSLLSGAQGSAVAAEQRAAAARVARRFATAYARSAYRRRPPPLPGASAALTRRLALAAAKVPLARRRLRPHPLAIVLELDRADTLRGSVEVGDGHSPPFSVGFTLKKRDVGWRVVSASPPG